MKRKLLLIFFILVLTGCRVTPTPRASMPTTAEMPATPAPVIKDTAAAPLPDAAPTGAPVEEELTATASPTAVPGPTEPPAVLVEPAGDLLIDYSRPFAGTQRPPAFKPQPYATDLDRLPLSLDSLANPEVLEGLTEDQRAAFSTNGFSILATGEAQFEEIRFSVAKQQGQPYYLTTDAAYHGLHVTFDELLKALERESFRPQMIQVSRQVLDEIMTLRTTDPTLKSEQLLAAAYMGVGLRLFDPQANIPADIEARVQAQINQIAAGGGQAQSVLIPGFKDDYGAYKAVGHYAGDEALESYFRGMTWFGRVSFAFTSASDPTYKPNRVPLIITRALRTAGEGAAANTWRNVNETLDFVIGPSDDAGPVELGGLMAQVYGPWASFTDLADEARWQEFLAQVDSLPAPQIHSTFLATTAELKAARDWRLMGQRFTFDASIFQNLIYDRVGTSDNPRKFPSGLDVMAVFGSPAAEQALEAAKQYDYAQYPEQMALLRHSANNQPADEWTRRFYSGWLYSFFPQVQAKDEAYPPYMRTPAWQYKELNTALGSWAELKRDTVLYNKMPEFLGGGGPPSSGPAHAYVEPNPEVFYRLAYIAAELGMGLNFRVDPDLTVPSMEQINLNQLIPFMEGMGRQFQELGDIAVKELHGEALTEDEYWSILSCIGIIECQPTAFPETPPVPVIAAVSGAEDRVLEAGTGLLDRIYVAVPINGALQVAQGGVFSYYEFTQPRSNRLSDQQWRAMLADGEAVRPAWTENYLLPGGEAEFRMVFRPGDWYIITEAGGTPPLNVRAQPSRSAAVLGKLETGAYLEILEGPVEVSGAYWWKINADFDNLEGWVMENPEWFDRAYGQ